MNYNNLKLNKEANLEANPKVIPEANLGAKPEANLEANPNVIQANPNVIQANPEANPESFPGSDPFLENKKISKPMDRAFFYGSNPDYVPAKKNIQHDQQVYYGLSGFQSNKADNNMQVEGRTTESRSLNATNRCVSGN